MTPKIHIENNISEHYTIIDVFAPNKTNLLYHITQTLSDLDLDIHTTKIKTQTDHTINAFYVKHKTHNKLQTNPELETLKTQLLQKLTNT